MSPAKNRGVMKEKTDTASNISADVSEASDKSQKRGKGKKTTANTEEKETSKAESSVEKMAVEKEVEEGDTMNASFEASEPRETENGVAEGDKDEDSKVDSKPDQEITDKMAETEEQNMEVADKQEKIVEDEDDDEKEEEEAINPVGKNKRKAPAKKTAKSNKRAKMTKKDDVPSADEEQMEMEDETPEEKEAEEGDAENTDEKEVVNPKEANKVEKPARGKKRVHHEEEKSKDAVIEAIEEKPLEAEPKQAKGKRVAKPDNEHAEEADKDDDKPKEAKPERQTRGKKGAKSEKEHTEEAEEDDDKVKETMPERQTRGKRGAKLDKEQTQESEDEMAEEKDKPKEAKPERQTRGKRGAKTEKEQPQESEDEKAPEPEKQTRGKKKAKVDEKKDDEEMAQVNTRQTRQKRNEDDKVQGQAKGAKPKEGTKKVEVPKNQRGARRAAVVEDSEDEDEFEPQKPTQNKKATAVKKASAKTSKAKVQESEEEEEEEEAPKPKRGEKRVAATKKATKNTKSKNEDSAEEEPQRPKRGAAKKAAVTKTAKMDLSEDEEEEEEDTKPKRGAAKKAAATAKSSKAKFEESDEEEVAKPKRGGRTAAKKADAKNSRNKVDDSESEDEEEDEQELPKQKKTAPKKANKASKAADDKKATSQSKTVSVTNDRKRKADSETKESEKQVKKAKQEHATATPIPARWNIPGLVLAMGSSDVGQLGLGPDLVEVSRAKRVDLGGDKVVQISAGGMHSLCVTAQGEVYSFGCNDEATLGRITEEEDDLSVPGKVEGIDGKVVQVVAGDSHSVALTEHGQVYIWGTFRDTNGVIGINPGDETLDSGKPEERRKQESGKEMGKSEKVEKPCKILRGIRVVKIAGGSAHILCLSDKGVVYSLGASDVGQLGRVGGWFSVRGGRLGIDSTLNAKPVRFNKRGLKCVDIWAGAYVSFAKTSEGEILSWGLNNYHQLGFPDIENRLFPEVTKMFDPALDWKEIACAEHHTVAMDGSGKVYVIGRKDYGRLGLGSVEKLDHVDELTLIKSLESTKCIGVGCGSSVSFAVAEDGTIYGWGMGSTMQLGMGDSEEDVEEPKPIKGKDLNNLKGVMAVAGGQHTLLLASE